MMRLSRWRHGCRHANRVLVSYGSYRSDRAGIRRTEYLTRQLAARRVDSMKTGVRADFPKVRSALSA